MKRIFLAIALFGLVSVSCNNQEGQNDYSDVEHDGRTDDRVDSDPSLSPEDDMEPAQDTLPEQDGTAPESTPQQDMDTTSVEQNETY